MEKLKVSSALERSDHLHQLLHKKKKKKIKLLSQHSVSAASKPLYRSALRFQLPGIVLSGKSAQADNVPEKEPYSEG